MHYAICYDLENDRLRDRTAKLLASHGCERIQKSVFVAAAMEKKHIMLLRGSLRRLFARYPLSPADSLILIPLRDEHVTDIEVFGNNNILPVLQEKLLKIVL